MGILHGLQHKGGKGLSWSSIRFNAVDWRGIDNCLATKSDVYGLWLCKQVFGVCTTRKNISCIQDLLNVKCPNCLQSGERATHLNLCPAEGRVQLVQDCMEVLECWVEQNNCIDPELAYWLAKYILVRGTKLFAELGPMSPAMLQVAKYQDTSFGGRFSWRAGSRKKYAYSRTSIVLPVCAG